MWNDCQWDCELIIKQLMWLYAIIGHPTTFNENNQYCTPSYKMQWNEKLETVQLRKIKACE